MAEQKKWLKKVGYVPFTFNYEILKLNKRTIFMYVLPCEILLLIPFPS